MQNGCPAYRFSNKWNWGDIQLNFLKLINKNSVELTLKQYENFEHFHKKNLPRHTLARPRTTIYVLSAIVDKT